MDFNAKTNPGRESRLQQLEEDKVWDVLIIGGGATGAGIAVDAAARGFSTVLFDTQDFKPSALTPGKRRMVSAAERNSVLPTS